MFEADVLVGADIIFQGVDILGFGGGQVYGGYLGERSRAVRSIHRSDQERIPG